MNEINVKLGEAALFLLFSMAFVMNEPRIFRGVAKNRIEPIQFRAGNRQLFRTQRTDTPLLFPLSVFKFLSMPRVATLRVRKARK